MIPTRKTIVFSQTFSLDNALKGVKEKLESLTARGGKPSLHF